MMLVGSAEGGDEVRGAPFRVTFSAPPVQARLGETGAQRPREPWDVTLPLCPRGPLTSRILSAIRQLARVFRRGSHQEVCGLSAATGNPGQSERLFGED